MLLFIALGQMFFQQGVENDFFGFFGGEFGWYLGSLF